MRELTYPESQAVSGGETKSSGHHYSGGGGGGSAGGGSAGGGSGAPGSSQGTAIPLPGTLTLGFTGGLNSGQSVMLWSALNGWDYLQVQTGGGGWYGAAGSGATPPVLQDLSPIQLFNYLTEEQGYTASAAAATTAMAEYGAVGASWGIGSTVGSFIYGELSQYDPSLIQAIGGTEAQMIADFNQGMSDFSNGNLTGGLSAIFGANWQSQASASPTSQVTDFEQLLEMNYSIAHTNFN